MRGRCVIVERITKRFRYRRAHARTCESGANTPWGISLALHSVCNTSRRSQLDSRSETCEFLDVISRTARSFASIDVIRKKVIIAPSYFTLDLKIIRA